MVIKTIAVLDPTANPKVIKEIPIAPRVHDLNNKVIGYLWNSKPNADILLLRIQENLSRRFLCTGNNLLSKPIASTPSDAAITEELTLTSDIVINAIGD